MQHFKKISMSKNKIPTIIFLVVFLASSFTDSEWVLLSLHSCILAPIVALLLIDFCNNLSIEIIVLSSTKALNNFFNRINHIGIMALITLFFLILIPIGYSQLKHTI
jgi:hypothetical protein